MYFLYFRLNFSTAFSSNAVSICKSVEINEIVRILLTTRYLITCLKKLNAKNENEVNK